MIRNVHERHLSVPVAQVAALLDSVATRHDRLWPRDLWPPLELDAPVGPGARGGHGPIRYSVTEYLPGRRLVFAFDPPTALVGTHRFEVEEHPDGGSVLRHVLQARASGAMRLLAPLAVLRLHDALIEDALDRAERSLGTGPARPARWSPWVRLLRRLAGRRPRPDVASVPVAHRTVALAGLPAPDFADAFTVALPEGASQDPRDWHRRMTRVSAPRWVAALVGVRSLLARALRLRTAGALREHNSPFTVISASDDVVVTGQDDTHLDFRVLLAVTPGPSGGSRLVLTTVVQRHNRVGQVYFAVIRPFHARIVPAILRRAVL